MNETPGAGPMLLAHGLNEPQDLHRQSMDFFIRFRDQSRRMACLAVPDSDHFDTADVLADEMSQLFETALDFVRR